ncbi:elongation factor P 5-aminopentanone reductase [Lactobacillus kefiranofaciens]|uniref:3-oxoacyl-[acyl-carrier protein] reductase n=1 Tax=Lactobacillus kefiranofaciens TaxID=267818 RepID=A0AAX3UED1_9LACO|nr:SDR family NAD(P)-dependent oxidoreductase [Lactobacillus kefiranofaciens]AEG40682.1 possible 3-oxoacyl-[acyl-carrier-protein] reductase [Lactobacillus kefiranofaciens subsp. kefiranofaciens]KRL24780.1 3-oxoacyl-ACP reductase [Lactobacillus kefiranofaciens subsp. kefirgranum DSM 10550 = JCM 8572]KRM22713.1 3-oxoacyl-ACP reductase [Lactobacillus kefiranofaciens subsp. kefiranofaciens DSM 5016 = JCM 6985]MCJ2171891.1 SDR family NAD(P)-dependent oxidoreductase [Lactobacillus kefiranofaciens]MC
MKRAIVFGATGGIGQAICRELALSGWSLYLHYNTKKEQAEQLAQELFAKYPELDFMPIQLNFATSDQELTSFVNSLLPVNAAIFAQGITNYGFLGDEKLTNISQVININLATPIKLTKLLEPQLMKQSFSRIVYLGSVYGGAGSALESVYSGTKSGLSRFAQAYAREVASNNLTVNVIAPGAVKTQMNSIFSQATIEEVQEEIPAGRWAQGEDISYWVKTILNPRSSYLTGQTIYVTGGWLL